MAPAYCLWFFAIVFFLYYYFNRSEGNFCPYPLNGTFRFFEGKRPVNFWIQLIVQRLDLLFSILRLASYVLRKALYFVEHVVRWM